MKVSHIRGRPSVTKNCLRMGEIWANKLLPKALKSGPKSNKLPNLVTLAGSMHLDYLKKSRIKINPVNNCRRRDMT